MNRDAMHRIVLIFILCAICFAGVATAADAVAALYDDIPQKNTPRKLQEAWLHFHESGLCQDVDAAFVFVDGGMQIWSRIEGDKGYLKFQELFEPLSNLHSVELYTNRVREKKEWDDEGNPPPSLWQNYELRSNLGDRDAQLSINSNNKEDRTPVTIIRPVPDSLLKQRILFFAEQMLNRNRKMEHYAFDLFALARTADNSDIQPDIRSKAAAICSVHAKSLEKSIGKLASDLEQAIPKSAKTEKGPTLPGAVNNSLTEEAELVYRSAQSVAARVHRFIFPEYYTVELGELRKPLLLESLKTLQQRVIGFQRTRAMSGRK
jgi:hypothetical protein